MSPHSWKDLLNQTIRPTPDARLRIAIVGMGHELRGDDAAGLMVARRLRGRPNWLVIDAGPVPENFTGKLRAFDPDVLLVVDAVHVGASPGTIRLLDVSDLARYSMTTHTLSPHLWLAHLRLELNGVIKFLGIQVERVSLGDDLSPAVRQSVEQVVQALEAAVVSQAKR